MSLEERRLLGQAGPSGLSGLRAAGGAEDGGAEDGGADENGNEGETDGPAGEEATLQELAEDQGDGAGDLARE